MSIRDVTAVFLLITFVMVAGIAIGVRLQTELSQHKAEKEPEPTCAAAAEHLQTLYDLHEAAKF